MCRALNELIRGVQMSKPRISSHCAEGFSEQMAKKIWNASKLQNTYIAFG